MRVFFYIKKKNAQFSKLCLLALFIAFCSTLLLFTEMANAQCKPMIKIDGKSTIVDVSEGLSLTLPYWLSAGQTLALGSSVNSISIIEFTANGTTLEFSKVINFTSTTASIVPANKVWKIESIAKQNLSSSYSSIIFDKAGAYTWIAPNCATELCIEAWGAGGGGGGGYKSGTSYGPGSGGGGGAYGSQCYSITPATSYAITVGAGGAGGTSGAYGKAGTAGGSTTISGTGISLTVNGGGGGGYGTGTAAANNGGAGGTSSANLNASGGAGVKGTSAGSGNGGKGGNGGIGGTGACGGTGAPGIQIAGGNGEAPGGGAAGGWADTGGTGADGKVIITW